MAAAVRHAVLAPALQTSPRRPKYLEIAEAQALFAAIEAGTHVRRE
jgi:hypothetical protein